MSSHFRLIKSRRWEEQVARMGDLRIRAIFWVEDLQENGNSEDLGIDDNIRIDLREIGWGRCGLDSYRSR
jgi:hypothetical protein